LAACLRLRGAHDAASSRRHDRLAKEPPNVEHQTLREHLSCLFQADNWYFDLIYVITLGGFLGLATFLPSFYFSQFHVSKVQGGTLTPEFPALTDPYIAAD
jgi:nitrate/nitrite transporter NarK